MKNFINIALKIFIPFFLQASNFDKKYILFNSYLNFKNFRNILENNFFFKN
jgi:hypothetical protein